MKAVKLAILLSAVLATSICLNAADQTKDKGKSSSKVADSGSFGIFMNGKRVGTETFNITETPNADQARSYSTASSEIKFDDGHFKATQTRGNAGHGQRRAALIQLARHRPAERRSVC